MAGKYPGDEFDLEGHHEGYDPDPLLSIRKSRLEAALREAIGWSDQHTDADMDAYVASALAKLEQA